MFFNLKNNKGVNETWMDWREKRQSKVQSSSMIFDDDLEDWRLWPGRIWIIFLDQVIENHYQGKFGFFVFSFYENLLKLEIFQSQTLKTLHTSHKISPNIP